MPDHDTRDQEGFEVEGSIIGWALQNREHVSALREAMNRRIVDEGLEEDQFKDNEELIVHMLDDITGVYQDLAKHHYGNDPAHMFEGGEYEV